MVRLKEINWELVDKYIESGCSGLEIARKLRIDSDTFYNRFKKQYGKNFSAVSATANEGCKADIRLSLIAKAVNNKSPGNATLLMFLARTMLGMREPEMISTDSPLEETINLRHENMMLKDELAGYKEHHDNNQS